MVPTIVFCNRIGALAPMLNRIAGPVHYLDFSESLESSSVHDFLEKMTGAEDLEAAKKIRQRRTCFRNKYIEFMGRINERNHSLRWWAMVFTDKNPLAPRLFQNFSNFLLIVETAQEKTGTLVVIGDSSDLMAQVREWARGERIQFFGSVKIPWSWRGFLRSHSPAGIMYACLRTIAQWFLSRRFRPARNRVDGYTVITSLIHPSSFPSEGTYRDTYFNPLVEHLTGQNQNTLIFALVLERPLEQLRKLRSIKSGLPIVPFDACLTLRDLVVCLCLALSWYARPVPLKGPVETDGLNLACLVKRTIREDRRSGNFFMALRIYYCASYLARLVRITRCVYPYENLSWEKMLLMGIRSKSPQTKMVGYQHSSLTISHTTLILQSQEVQIVPLPDKILTTGSVTKDWLEKDGNYPAGTFQTACALRQSRSSLMKEQKQNRKQAHRSRANIQHLLVALGTSIEEYVRTLVFLENALAETNSYQVRIRPHPLIGLEPALKVAALGNQEFFSVSNGPLAQDLEWADAVLYASSTVGLEAVSLGIPAIFLDLDDFLDTDPMFDWADFKWVTSRPSELAQAVRSIDALSDSRFQELQVRGRDYADAYLGPLTEDGLRVFCEA